MIDKGMTCHGFLFANDKGPWSTDRLTKILIEESSKRMGFRMTVSEYRYIAIAIDRQYIWGLPSSCLVLRPIILWMSLNT